MEEKKDLSKYLFLNSLCAGFSGIAMDFILFPLDTMKTRLQSHFFKKNIFKNPYQGFLPHVLGSGPFYTSYFFIYESTKIFLQKTEIPLLVK